VLRHFPAYDRLYLVTMFAKNEQGNLTAAERNEIRAVIARIGKALAEGDVHA
jgi:hypothetical protein